MQEANGGKVQSRRLEWMYNDAANKRDDDDDNNNNNGVDKEEIEQFLLGKKSKSEIVQQKTLKDMVPFGWPWLFYCWIINKILLWRSLHTRQTD